MEGTMRNDPAGRWRAIHSVLQHTLPLDIWLRVPQKTESVGSRHSLGGALAPARGLYHQLHALGLGRGPEHRATLELALLVDAVDPDARGSSPVAVEIRRQLLHEAGGPLDHAVCLLGDTRNRQLGLLGRPPCIRRIRSAARDLSDQIGRSSEPLLTSLDSHLLKLQARGLTVVPSLCQPGGILESALSRAFRIGSSALSLAEGCPDVWEIQRSGFRGVDLLIGDLFGPLVVIEALAGAGIDATELLDHVLTSRQGEGLRYYRGKHLPNDSDDAAALLLAVDACGSLETSHPLIDEARQVLKACRDDDGGIQSWADLPGQTLALPADEWFGPHCCAVVGRALRAMAADTGSFSVEGLVQTACWLADRADTDGGMTGIYYTKRIIATSMVVKAFAAAARRSRLPEEVAIARDRAVGWLLAQQGPMGVFGSSALETASAMIGLATANELTAPVAAEGAAFLVSSQRWDGQWSAGDYFLTPSPQGLLKPIGWRTQTTAFALDALAAARRVLPDG